VLWRPPGYVLAPGLSTHPDHWLPGREQSWCSPSGGTLTPPSFIYSCLESKSIQSCLPACLSTWADKREVAVGLNGAAEPLYHPRMPWAGADAWTPPSPIATDAWLPRLPPVTPTFHPICNPVPQAVVPVSPLQRDQPSGLSREQTSGPAAFPAEDVL